MKRLICILSLILSGCVSINIEKANYNEYLGSNGKIYENKIFEASCKYDYSNFHKKCLTKIAKFVKEHGYEYFTMIYQNKDTNTTTGVMPIHSGSYNYRNNAYTSTTSYVPYSSTEEVREYVFVLMNESDIENTDNYYKVSNYYTD